MEDPYRHRTHPRIAIGLIVFACVQTAAISIFDDEDQVQICPFVVSVPTVLSFACSPADVALTCHVGVLLDMLRNRRLVPMLQGRRVQLAFQQQLQELSCRACCLLLHFWTLRKRYSIRTLE